MEYIMVSNVGPLSLSPASHSADLSLSMSTSMSLSLSLSMSLDMGMNQGAIHELLPFISHSAKYLYGARTMCPYGATTRVDKEGLGGQAFRLIIEGKTPYFFFCQAPL